MAGNAKATHFIKGQSTIELSILLSAVLLLFFSGVKIADLIRQKMKHQYIEKPINLNFDLKFSDDVLFFETKNNSHNASNLESKGWYRVNKHILKKDQKYIFINGDLGVIYD